MISEEPGPAVNSSLQLPKLPALRDAAPANWFGRFLLSGQRGDDQEGDGATYPWYVVLWLTGVDYFSTLGYQPGIALLAAGAISVPATAILVAVTLLGAVPVYAEVAKRSYAGQGSIALLENLLSGWQSKIFVLVLLGFAGTDFVITMTLSAADAARHAVANPYLHPYVGDRAIGLTLLLLLLLAIVFFVGFREAIGLAQVVAIPYLVLNVIVLLRGLWEIAIHPNLLSQWHSALNARGDWTLLFVGSALMFPKLALGLSGFETGVSVMPLISNEDGNGKATEETGSAPQGRIRATRKLLLSAALIMSAMLLLSSFVAALLIPEAAYRESGEAAGRAIAYLAHKYLGNGFGAIYDFSTILILWFAGASAMTGLLNLIPRYLPRFGMAPRWVSYRRPLVLVLFAIDVVITLIFRADVEAQGGAYATGVLVLMLSAAVAVTIALWRECSVRRPQSFLLVLYFFVVTLVFAFTLIDNVIGRPDGIIIATTFIVLLLAASGISRYFRSTEMRISEASFVDQSSAELWASITGKKVNLVPYSRATPEYRAALAGKIRQYYVLEGPLAFLHVSLLDNRSEFVAKLWLKVYKEGENIVVEVSGAVAIANTVAYLSELLAPSTIIAELTSRNLMKQALAYLFWGEGETGLMVYSILVRYWEWTGQTTGRPRICLMSE